MSFESAFVLYLKKLVEIISLNQEDMLLDRTSQYELQKSSFSQKLN